MRSDKRNRKQVAFLSADQIEDLAATAERQAEQLSRGEARLKKQHIAAQLRVYATMKRVLAPQRANESINAERGSAQ
jgi:hypothetical protein